MNSNSFILTVGDKEYRIKPLAAAVTEAEKRIDRSLLAAMDDVDRTEYFAAFLWAGLQKYNNGMPMPRVYALIDAMNEEGCSFCGQSYEEGSTEMRGKLALEVLKVGGFFTKKQIETMETTMAEMTPDEDTTT